MKQKTKFKQTEIGMIPEEWEVKPIGEAMGVNPKREVKKGIKTKYVAMQDLKEFNKKVLNFIYRDFKGGSKFKNGDTLMARITPCLENGKTAFVDFLDETEIANGSTEFIVLSGKEDETTNEFVYYLSISPNMRADAIQSMTGTSGRQRVQIDLLASKKIAIPPILEQEAIANILSSLDKKIELNQQMNKTLEAIGQAIFKRWFVDFEFPNEQGKPYKSSGGEMVESELGKIPKGWRAGSFEDVIKEKRTKIKDRDAQVLSAVKAGELVNSKDFFNKKVYSDKLNKYLEVEKFDFAYNPSRINIGSIGMLKKDILGAVSPVYVVFSCNGNHYFVEQALKLLFIKSQILKFCSGTVRQSLTYDGFRRIQIVVPPKGLVLEFNKILEKLLEYKSQIYENIVTLTKIRDLLLPKLMLGKIRVPVEVKAYD